MSKPSVPMSWRIGVLDGNVRLAFYQCGPPSPYPGGRRMGGQRQVSLPPVILDPSVPSPLSETGQRAGWGEGTCPAAPGLLAVAALPLQAAPLDGPLFAELRDDAPGYPTPAHWGRTYEDQPLEAGLRGEPRNSRLETCKSRNEERRRARERGRLR